MAFVFGVLQFVFAFMVMCFGSIPIRILIKNVTKKDPALFLVRGENPEDLYLPVSYLKHNTIGNPDANHEEYEMSNPDYSQTITVSK